MKRKLVAGAARFIGIEVLRLFGGAISSNGLSSNLVRAV